jgi:hypothetical protein
MLSNLCSHPSYHATNGLVLKLELILILRVFCFTSLFSVALVMRKRNSLSLSTATDRYDRTGIRGRLTISTLSSSGREKREGVKKEREKIRFIETIDIWVSIVPHDTREIFPSDFRNHRYPAKNAMQLDIFVNRPLLRFQGSI